MLSGLAPDTSDTNYVPKSSGLEDEERPVFGSDRSSGWPKYACTRFGEKAISGVGADFDGYQVAALHSAPGANGSGEAATEIGCQAASPHRDTATKLSYEVVDFVIPYAPYPCLSYPHRHRRPLGQHRTFAPQPLFLGRFYVS
jgi:hypothetical protein